MEGRLPSANNIRHNQYGLIGYPLSHAWSGKYFAEKFRKEGIRNCSYSLFPLKHLDELPGLLSDIPQLKGFNVTIPYKEKILPFLDSLDDTAAAIGAVNTVAVSRTKDGRCLLKGYNTDACGFEQSLVQAAVSMPQQALILGTGGASRAVAYVLKKNGCTITFVSRMPGFNDMLSYYDLDRSIIQSCGLIINTTPLGMYPDTSGLPPIPYQYLNDKHILYDLVYNPPMTNFLRIGKTKNCTIIQGGAMLQFQAENAWKIWQKENS